VGLTKIAIQRPVFVLMLMLGAILIGYLSLKGMRVEQNPDVSFGTVIVSTIYPGAGPEEVAELVSRRIEESVSGISGLREVTSSSQEGVSLVTVALELGTNVDVALNDIRSKIDQITNQLPDGVERPTITKLDAGSQPVLYYSLSSPTLSSLELRDLADNVLQDRFGQIPGVGAATAGGGDQREIQIQIKPDRLLAYGIGASDVLNAVKASSQNLPAGRIVQGDQEVAVRVPSDFTKLSDIAGTVITVRDQNQMNAPPKMVRLSDVAEIKDASIERRNYSRLEGKDSVIIVLQKTKEGNAVEISQAAEALATQLGKQYNLTFTKTFDQADQIKSSLEDLQISIALGVLLVTLIVYIFLHNFRGMLIVAIAIPLCIFATFIAMSLFGFTLNNMTLLAVSLSVGVLVDDAIVVLENIYRHLKMGEDPKDAALNGRGEIGLAAIAITLADVVVFLPIANMGGIVGQFFRPLALSFAAAVVVSLGVSFVVTPMLASRWYRKGENAEHATGWFAKGFEAGFGKLEGFYRRVLQWALNHRWFVFISGNVVLFAVFMFIAGSFAPDVASVFMTPQGPGPGIMLMTVALVIGIGVLGLNYWPKVLSGKVRARIFLGFFALGFLMMTAPTLIGALSQAHGFFGMVIAGVITLAMGLIKGFFVGLAMWFVVMGVIGVFANLIKPRTRTRLIGSALLFGLVFPFASLVGHFYAQWKQGAVFNFQFMPNSDGGQVAIDIQLPPGSSLAKTQRVVDRVEQIAQSHPDARYVLSQVGTLGSGGFGDSGNQGSQYAKVSVTLFDKKAIIGNEPGAKLRTRSDEAVAADLIQMIGRIPGADLKIAASAAQGFGAPIQMSFASENRNAAIETAAAIKRRLDTGVIKGVINAEVSSKPGKPELRIIPDRIRLANYGMTVAEVAGAMRLLYEGDDSTKLRVSGREYPVRVMMDVAERNDPDTINKLPVKFSNGNPIYLSSVVGTTGGTSPDKIDRRNREEEVRLTANLLPGFSAGSVQAQIDALIQKESLIPEGVKLKPLGQADATARETGYLFGALGLGFVLVYMLLASLYDNLLYPLIIQLAQPQAFVGALLALIITDKSLNIVGFIGLICLVGLVGKNAILLVDYANTLRARGRSRHDALVEAGPTRLRPIMMTTLALILGMLPVALAIGRGSEFRETIGIIIIGGISLSTLLTLVVIPCAYTIFDDASIGLGKLLRRGEPDDEGPMLPVSPPESETMPVGV
jgi:multidrug efflux pump subunit AcrB